MGFASLNPSYALRAAVYLSACFLAIVSGALMSTTPKDNIKFAFYASVGQAISIWTSMESILVGIAAILLDEASLKKPD
jgi:hypothetical protein